MALTMTQIQQISDSYAQGISDYNTGFNTNTGVNAPTANTIINGLTGIGASQTQGRILASNDLTSELFMLPAMNKSSSLISAYIASVRSIAGFYQTLYPALDAFDNAVGGMNAILPIVSGGPLQVNAWFANAFNSYQSVAVALGYRTSATVPTAIAAGNYFPYAAIDTMWGFTCSGATTFSTNAVGTNASTAVAGGGVGQFYIYKNNASAAAGTAVFTITYTNAAGSSATATYTTTAGTTPAGSGSLAAGYAITSCIGSAITAVTGTGMTNAEQYTIGMKLVRASAY